MANEYGRWYRCGQYNFAGRGAAIYRKRARSGLRWIGDPEWAPHIEPLPFANELTALRQQADSREEFTGQLPDAWMRSAFGGFRRVAG